jgi:hypothetical protein
MKKILYVVIAIALFSCGEQKQESTPAKPEVALPASGVGDNNVFKATGEVVVIFEPSQDRANKFKAARNQEVLKHTTPFLENAQDYIKKLEAMGIKAYTSQEDDIKINVSENQFYVVYAAGVSEGYGIALAKLNAQPKLIKGIPTWEELEKEVKAYYGK